MPVEVILPRVDMDMATGRVSRWYVAEGDAVRQGEPLFEIETDKAAMEIESPASGTLRGIMGADGAALPVGSVIGWIYAQGEAYAAPDAPVADAPVWEAPVGEAPVGEAPVVEAAAVAEAPVASVPGGSVPGGAVPATPLARRLARHHAVELRSIDGTGPRRRVQARDVTAAVAERNAAKAAPAPVPAAVAASVPAAVAAAPLAAAPVAAAGALPHGALLQGAVLHRSWLRQGEGRPLVLVHGFGADLNGWRPLAASLPPGRPILAVDLPGHGLSAAASAPSVAGMAAALGDTLAAERIGAADVIGHSLGAAIAVALAETAAFEMRSLLLLSPAGLGPDINGAFVDGFVRARSEASLGPWLRLLVGDPATISQGFIAATARARAMPGVAEAQAEIARVLFPDGTQAFSVRAGLERLTMPVRVVFGADDRIIPHRHAADLPGHVALHMFRGVGHLPQLELGAALARIVAEHTRG